MVGTKSELKVPAVGWAARDPTGHMTPFTFKRRYVTHYVVQISPFL